MRHPGTFFSYEAYGLPLQRKLLTLGVHGLKPWLSLLLAVVLALTSRGSVQTSVIAGWLLVMLACTALGYAFRHFFEWRRRQGLSARHLRQIEWAGLIYGAATGLAWGSSGQLLVPDNAEHNVVVIMVYLGVCAGAGSINTFGLGHLLLTSLLAAILFLSPMPMIFPDHWAQIVLMFTLYHGAIVRMSWERNRILIENLLLNAEKDELLAQSHHEAQRAVQASEEKSAFLAAASHDLRQPVHALMLTSHALRMRVGEGENAALVDRILEAGQVLADQFNSLMDLSRLESGAYPLNLADVPLAELLQQVLSSRQPLATSRGLTLRLRIGRTLCGCALHTDAQLLSRLIGNLLDNAIKFSTDGQRVLLTARLRKGLLQIAVHDRGIGIAAADLGRIFKPYVQLRNPVRERARGIGLGLSIAREAAECLDAQLDVHSRPGIGSTFTVTCAARRTRIASQDQTVVRQQLAVPDAAQLEGQRLLLVEDDPIAATALMTLAGDWGLQIRHCSDPREVATEPQPDLIICDIRLPGPRDGIEWLSEWLLQWPDTRGLLLSGELLAETHQRAEQEGLLLLSKPVNPSVLLQTLTRLGARPDFSGGQPA